MCSLYQLWEMCEWMGKFSLSLSVFRRDDARRPDSTLCAASHVNIPSMFVLEWVPKNKKNFIPLLHWQPILLRQNFLYASGQGANLHTSCTVKRDIYPTASFPGSVCIYYIYTNWWKVLGMCIIPPPPTFLISCFWCTLCGMSYVSNLKPTRSYIKTEAVHRDGCWKYTAVLVRATTRNFHVVLILGCPRGRKQQHFITASCRKDFVLASNLFLIPFFKHTCFAM